MSTSLGTCSQHHSPVTPAFWLPVHPQAAAQRRGPLVKMGVPDPTSTLPPPPPSPLCLHYRHAQIFSEADMGAAGRAGREEQGLDVTRVPAVGRGQAQGPHFNPSQACTTAKYPK